MHWQPLKQRGRAMAGEHLGCQCIHLSIMNAMRGCSETWLCYKNTVTYWRILRIFQGHDFEFTLDFSPAQKPWMCTWCCTRPLCNAATYQKEGALFLTLFILLPLPLPFYCELPDRLKNIKKNAVCHKFAWQKSWFCNSGSFGFQSISFQFSRYHYIWE